jgi:6,7-dimethyl-8-ribityllumazine synthase
MSPTRRKGARSRAARPAPRALVVVSRFNERVTQLLLDGARAELDKGGYQGRTDVLWVPGAFEIPVALARGIVTGRYEVAVALGCVIRGETPHFDYVAGEATRGIGEVARRTGVPVGFGVLTCDTEEQAFARAGGTSGNKGEDAARAAVETARAIAELEHRA